MFDISKNLFGLCPMVNYFVICPVPGCGTMVEGCPLASCIASTLTLEIVVPIIHATLRSLRQWLAFLSRKTFRTTRHVTWRYISSICLSLHCCMFLITFYLFTLAPVSFIKRICFNCNTESRTMTNRSWRCSDYKIIPKQADSCWGFPKFM